MAAPPVRRTSSRPAARAESFGGTAPDLDRPLWELLGNTAANYPGHDAVVSLWQGPATVARSLSIAAGQGDAHSIIRWSYADLVRLSTRLAECLRARGCVSGMRMVVVLWNSAEWSVFFWAAARLGLPFVPIDPRSADGDVQHYMKAVQPTILVTQDSDITERLRKLSSAQAEASASSSCLLRICCTPDSDVEGWKSLETVLRTPRSPGRNGSKAVEPARGDSQLPRVIVFTSGTTGTPKGCLHTSANIWSQVSDFDPDPEHCKDRWCIHTPLSHIFGINNSLRAWRYGGTAVYPSKSFEVKATLRALVEEKCTFMSAVPALVKALISDQDFPGREKTCLRYVSLGSTLIEEEDIMLCKSTLCATQDAAAIQCYGMSEGAPVTSWARDDPLFENGYHTGTGKILPGCNLRICKPGTREVVGRNEKGELHIGGTSIISGYLDALSQESFYNDDTGNWFMTGDQAVLDEDGVLHIVGRYKDIIIRGGSNIAPATIEMELNKLDGVLSQVIGIADPIAGQVPVAIIKCFLEEVSKQEVAAKASALGKEFVLAAVYTLEELGLIDFPVTLSGKVRKEELRANVVRHRRRLQTPPPEAGGSFLGHIEATKRGLQEIWQALIGMSPGYDDLVTEFADSITILRFCDKVTTSLGKRIYLQDFIQHPTISSQASLLEERATMLSSGTKRHFPSHATGASQSLKYSRISCGTSPATRPIENDQRTAQIHAAAAAVVEANGLSVADVQDILPIRDSYHRLAIGPRPQSYRIRFALRIQTGEVSRVVHALERALSSRPMFRTLLCQAADGLFHVVMKPSAALFEHLIENITVDTDGQRDEVIQDQSPGAFSAVFMFQSKIISVRETTTTTTTPPQQQETYVSATFNHSVFDALSLLPWHRDIDRLVADPDGYAIPAQAPFRMFADLTHLYQDSLPARASVDFNVARLRGLSRFRAALWPPQRAPGWHISSGGDDDSVAPPDVAAARAAARAELWGGGAGSGSGSGSGSGAGTTTPAAAAAIPRFPRTSRLVHLPGMEALRAGPARVEPSLLAKTAVALLNVHATRQPYALFNHLDAARAWPFVPGWMGRGLPPPMSIDGPTFEFVLNMAAVDIPWGSGRGRGGGDAAAAAAAGGGGERGDEGKGGTGETVRELLARMGSEHEELGRHAHAPWRQVLDALGGEEAAVAEDAAMRQTFVWDVSLRLMDPQFSDYQALRVVGRYDWADCGLFWNCCMLDKANMMVVASWDTAQMNDAEMDGHCDALADAVRRLADPANLDRRLAEVFAAPLGYPGGAAGGV
ncbi:hypothetical protein GGR56DRAFT_665271 [Xylariaceae sp. FL0804]|nr:hypothetical protein GGR56DRAFT_665271 [Xylariaceae sp. FL0804]